MKNNKLRGWLGEKKTAFGMWVSLSGSVYRRFHDVIIPSKNGTTQIDHLLVSPYGVFIVETKNKKGWIFGSADQPRWTQTLYGGKKYSFQNPLRQTFRQKKVLCQFLDLPEKSVHTVVFFAGDSEFKTNLPPNVIDYNPAGYIRDFRKQVLSANQVNGIVQKLNRHIGSSTLTSKDHLRSLKERHSSNTVCPKCGSALVKRMARKGPRVGKEFLGCENYPRCKYTKNL